ncbi:MAG: hypothetical protein Fur0022_28090 [Anaerolineales bacterium]
MLFLPLLFHFNQHLNENAHLASQVCYRGLLRTLRANPSLRANIHISGTLITALKWLDPEPLEMIRDGVSDGQFEIVGSTFAQNVPYATDDWDNARQIELHQQVLENTFGVTPTTFWNPERCWRQSLVPIIAAAGYRTITIEDHILEASGGRTPCVYQTRAGDHSLSVVRDDERLKHLFNFAAWFGNCAPLLTYLSQCQTEFGEGTMAYAEDAEAMGLWGYSQGVIPNQTWDRLNTLLETLATRKDVKPILFAEIPAPAQDLTPIKDGSAAWMNVSLAKEGAPYHEDGYTDWFDFHAHSPKLAKFRQFYTELRKYLQATAKSLTHKGTQQLYRQALHCYLTHQYEFGCIGIGSDTYRGWLGAKAARVLAASAIIATLSKRSGDPIQFTIVEDLSQDGVLEWIHANDTKLFITSPVGGRLLYWMNLKNGQIFVGNPSAVVFGAYERLATPPKPIPRPNLWLPAEEEPYAGYVHPEQPPTRLGKYIPAWVWEENPAPVSLATRNMQLEGTRTTLPAQQGAFCDEIWLDGILVFQPADLMEAQGAKEAIRFYKPLDATMEFRKKYTLHNHTTTVIYTFTNSSAHTRAVRMHTTSELALNYTALLQQGRAALAFLPDQPGVINPLTGETLMLTSTHPIDRVTHSPALLGLIVGLEFEIAIPPGESRKFSVHLTKKKKGRVI